MINKRKRRKPTELAAISLQDTAVDFEAWLKKDPDALKAYDAEPWTKWQSVPIKDGRKPTVWHFRTLTSDEVDMVDTWAVQHTAFTKDNVYTQQKTLRRLAAFDKGLTRIENWDADTPMLDLTQEPSRFAEVREAVSASIRREIGSCILAASEEVDTDLGK